MIIYGCINLNRKRKIDKEYLYKKLLEVEQIIELVKTIESKYVYSGIRTCISIELYLNKRVSNREIIKTKTQCSTPPDRVESRPDCALLRCVGGLRAA